MGFWDSIYGGMRELFWFAVRELMGYGGSFLSTIIGTIAGYLPEGVGSSLVSFSVYIDVVNAWIPLDLGLVLFSTWLSARLVVLTVRHIIKMIPTVG